MSSNTTEPLTDCSIHTGFPGINATDCCNQTPLITCANGRVTYIGEDTGYIEGEFPHQIGLLYELVGINIKRTTFPYINPGDLMVTLW
jgi:hypothetical protein